MRYVASEPDRLPGSAAVPYMAGCPLCPPAPLDVGPLPDSLNALVEVLDRVIRYVTLPDDVLLAHQMLVNPFDRLEQP